MGAFVLKGYQKGSELEPIVSAVKAIATLLLLFAVFRLNELTNFTFSIDDEFAAFRVDAATGPAFPPARALRIVLFPWLSLLPAGNRRRAPRSLVVRLFSTLCRVPD